MLDLRFRSKDIAAWERENDKSIFDLLDTKLENLAAFICLGVGCNEEKAYDILDSELEKEGIDTLKVLENIIKELQRYGFFPQKMCVAAIMQKMENQIAKIEEEL